ncbi:uncharacterized protein LOC121815826 [Xyrichtys novacula]|uniref:Uncharacterized protein LOC121815826 n=1 Tax=Xyrichtys novacula TaxID=13765 RepID=A0AAV1FGK4_XYRNO|nr:uncharacterized protein LOC121815826 [Xyrichtys novacula]
MERSDPYSVSDHLRKCSQLPPYLQDYEVGYPAKHQPPYYEQARHTISPEVLQYINNMREEHDQLRRDLQCLTEVISSSLVLAPQHTMSQSRLREDETSSTSAHASKLVPSRGHKDPHQHECPKAVS